MSNGVRHQFRAVSRFFTTETIFRGFTTRSRVSDRRDDREILDGNQQDPWLDNENTDMPDVEQGRCLEMFDGDDSKQSSLSHTKHHGREIDYDSDNTATARSTRLSFSGKLPIQPRVEPLQPPEDVIRIQPGDISGDNSQPEKVTHVRRRSKKHKRRRKVKSMSRGSEVAMRDAGDDDTDIENLSRDPSNDSGHMSVELRSLAASIQTLDHTLKNHIRTLNKNKPPGGPQLSAADRQGMDFTRYDPPEEHVKQVSE